jgi:hypothetical protein
MRMRPQPAAKTAHVRIKPPAVVEAFKAPDL